MNYVVVSLSDMEQMGVMKNFGSGNLIWELGLISKDDYEVS